VAQRTVDGVDQVAILYRTNWQARPFTIALRQRGLPYRSTLQDRAEGARGDPDSWPAELPRGEEMACDADDAKSIRLSTIHQAKGGEWTVVFVVGLEEGLLPHARALGDDADQSASIDEERRVAYVAVTRARERLYLSYCRTRRRGDRTEMRKPSRFLHGLPLAHVKRTA